MSNFLTAYLESFALPGTGFDESFASELATIHARQTVARVLQRNPEAFLALGPGVPERVHAAASGPLDFDAVWCRAIGAAWAHIRADPSYSAEVIAPLLAEWATLRPRSPASTPSGMMRFYRGTHEITIRYKESMLPDDSMGEDALSSAEHPFVAALLNDAFDFIDRFSPEYGPWVLQLLRDVVPLESPPDCIRSGSSVAEPGSCHISFRSGPVPLAEMLVHETTHQYYYLLTRFGPVDDGTDEHLYYSPAKQCGRPIAYILIAYHAFANVLLFSRRCLAAGYNDPDGYLHRNVHILTGWINKFEEALQRTNALTECGRALWVPLARELHSHQDPPTETRTTAALAVKHG